MFWGKKHLHIAICRCNVHHISKKIKHVNIFVSVAQYHLVSKETLLIAEITGNSVAF